MSDAVDRLWGAMRSFGSAAANAYGNYQDNLAEERKNMQFQTAMVNARSSINEFHLNLQTNPNYHEYLDLWEERQATLHDELTAGIEDSDALQQFELAYNDMTSTAQFSIMQLAQTRETQALRVTGYDNLDRALASPSFEGAITAGGNMLQALRPSGLYSADEKYEITNRVEAELVNRFTSEAEDAIARGDTEELQHLTELAISAKLIHQDEADEYIAEGEYQIFKQNAYERALANGYEGGIAYLLNGENEPELRTADRDMLIARIEGQYASFNRIQDAREAENREAAKNLSQAMILDGDLTIEMLYGDGRFAALTATDREHYTTQLQALNEAATRAEDEVPEVPEATQRLTSTLIIGNIEQFKDHEVIDQQIMGALKAGEISEPQARIYLNMNANNNPDPVMAGAAAAFERAFNEKLIDEVQFATMKLEFNALVSQNFIDSETGELRPDRWNDHTVMQAVDNILEPARTERVNNAVRDIYDTDRGLFRRAWEHGVGADFNRIDAAERLQQQVDSGELVGTIDNEGIMDVVQRGLTDPDAIRAHMLGRRDYDDLDDREKQILENNTNLASLVVEQEQIFQEDFGEEPRDVLIQSDGNPVYRDSMGDYWTVRIGDEDEGDPRDQTKGIETTRRNNEVWYYWDISQGDWLPGLDLGPTVRIQGGNLR